MTEARLAPGDVLFVCDACGLERRSLAGAPGTWRTVTITRAEGPAATLHACGACFERATLAELARPKPGRCSWCGTATRDGICLRCAAVGPDPCRE